MSGGHWDYCGARIRDGLEAMGEDKEIKKRFPDLAIILEELAWVFYKMEHEMDLDLKGDSKIKDDREFENQAIGKVLDVVLKNTPDKWFSQAKWTTIQAFQRKSGSESWNER